MKIMILIIRCDKVTPFHRVRFEWKSRNEGIRRQNKIQRYRDLREVENLVESKFLESINLREVGNLEKQKHKRHGNSRGVEIHEVWSVRCVDVLRIRNVALETLVEEKLLRRRNFRRIENYRELVVRRNLFVAPKFQLIAIFFFTIVRPPRPPLLFVRFY